VLCAFCFLLLLHKQMGNIDMAIVYYQSALRLKPYFTDAYNNMASALVQKGLIPEAMDCYMQVGVNRCHNPDCGVLCGVVCLCVFWGGGGVGGVGLIPEAMDCYMQVCVVWTPSTGEGSALHSQGRPLTVCLGGSGSVSPAAAAEDSTW
jgi:hypothetical protein